MLVSIFRHSEAAKQGDKPKYSGKYQGPVRTSRGVDEALVLLDDGHFVTAEFQSLVVVPEEPAKPLEQKSITPAKKVIVKDSK